MRILLVEDNPDLGDAVESKLRNAGHSVRWVRDGLVAVQWGGAQAWDAVVLYITLPGKDGYAVLREWRAAGLEAPVLVMTARAEIEDKVDMLDLGADDYLVKPFDLRELEARLRALMRRPTGQTSSVVVLGDLSLDMSGRTVTINGQLLELGRREFRLLEILLTRQGQTVAKERLMAQLFDAEDISLNALELLISRLRKKLSTACIEIVTVRGVGYQARTDAST
ncbi:response regulator transcription factor [Bordetella holmesii]|uniref:Response regulator receiver domain protein n=2 Tax=Bordetella holmesii TaxID=35814 RepID=A0A158M050_9BORD|nr:response regulator transcription factor [Bordetella holmesii]AIT25994.1 DNA-binding response regulator [Bordetella holmesii 44057]EWM44307.1 DNA-binding response regulator [Bordetella holmesii 41130]EWM46566.1 DNA-binding response regulator [Bordetella holmesii 35009]EWM50730.1 DNA-binding response regulator [Bordetella holmesii 70147]AMD45081.1 two-component system response regulator [Bordetella holmesii H558]